MEEVGFDKGKYRAYIGFGVILQLTSFIAL
jgi:hypothetical protein